MKRIFLSTVKFHHWTEDFNEQINNLKEFDIDGVELAFRWNEELSGLRLSEENKKYLNSFEFNSMHAPFKDSLDEETITKISEIAKDINARNVVFHPEKILDGKSSHFDILIENMRIKEPLAEELLKKNKNFKLCLDLSHSNIIGETERLFKSFNDRIAEVHFSANSETGRHVPLIKAKDGFFDDLDMVKKLDVPFVLEAGYAPGDIQTVKKDIEFAKRWLGK